jgi:uncharacterized protein (TIGR03435 family)
MLLLRAIDRGLCRALLAVCVVALACPAGAQPTAQLDPSGPPAYKPTLTFDVASVRETQQAEDNPSWGLGIVSTPHSSQFEAEGVSPKVLIQYAYGFGPFEMSGGPEWLTSSLWVVQAKSDHDVDAQLARLTDDQSRLEKQHMLQALLADRFMLKVHWETRQATIYALVIAKGGSKLQPAKTATPDPDIPGSTPETKGSDIQSHAGPHGRELEARYISAKGIAGLLGALLRVTVEDRTGLDGRYDFTLHYSYQSTDPDSFPPIVTAIQEQLGLKLESSRGSVDVLVIDHIERPSAN